MEGLDRIIVHWTAGGYQANNTDKAAYHFIVEGNGNIVTGTHSVWNNYKPNMERINIRIGNYAKHCGGGNSGAIGISMAGMAGYVSRSNIGKFPLTKVQCEVCFKKIAELCREYKIDPTNVWTHYEFGRLNPKSKSAGKIDITFLPPYPEKKASEIGGFIRDRVRAILGIKSPSTSSQTSSNIESTSSDSAITGGAASVENVTKEIGETSSSLVDSSTGSEQKTFKELLSFGSYKDTSGKPLAWLRTTNNWLERFPSVMSTALVTAVGRGENITQDKVDEICEWLSNKCNRQIEEKRQWLIKCLYKQYTSNTKGPVWKAAFAIQSFFSDPLGAVGDFASSIWKPVKVVFEWAKVLIKELPRLAENLANIASSLPPPPPSPHINFDKFKIKVNSIGMKEIVKGPSGLKDPKEMYPDLDNPFIHDSFILFNDGVVDSLDDGSWKKEYVLKQDDFETMSEALMNAAKPAGLDEDLSITYTDYPSISSLVQGAINDRGLNIDDYPIDYFEPDSTGGGLIESEELKYDENGVLIPYIRTSQLETGEFPSTQDMIQQEINATSKELKPEFIRDKFD